MLNVVRWILGGVVAMLVIAPPLIAYRYQYVHAKRFHEVIPGRVYRSGQMTADGFRETIERYHIKTVINLQHEQPDPLLPDRWLGKGKIRESELCRELGAKYVLITPDVLPPDNRLDVLPPAVDEFLKLLDDESNYPILLHCKAGSAPHRPADGDLSDGIHGLVAGRGAARTSRQRLRIYRGQRGG